MANNLIKVSCLTFSYSRKNKKIVMYSSVYKPPINTMMIYIVTVSVAFPVTICAVFWRGHMSLLHKRHFNTSIAVLLVIRAVAPWDVLALTKAPLGLDSLRRASVSIYQISNEPFVTIHVPNDNKLFSVQTLYVDRPNISYVTLMIKLISMHFCFI